MTSGFSEISVILSGAVDFQINFQQEDPKFDPRQEGISIFQLWQSTSDKYISQALERRTCCCEGILLG